MTQWQEKWPKNISSLLTQDRKMDPGSLISRVFSYNQQPGADQTKTPTSREGQSLPLLSEPIWALSGLNFGYKTMTTEWGACSNSCPLSQWCHPTISSSVVHFSSCLQSFPTSGSYPMRHQVTLHIRWPKKDFWQCGHNTL